MTHVPHRPLQSAARQRCRAARSRWARPSRDGGTNFAMEAAAADSMLVCLFDEGGAESQIPLLDYDAGVWHGFVPGVGAGQAYGYRAGGRYDPGSGLRFNPAKLLLDPYARAISGR